MSMNLTFIGTGDAFSSGNRFNTCLKLDAGAETMLVDLGGSAMLGLQHAGIDRGAVGTLLFTHYHGDHFAGLPFFILDAMFVTRRTRPLTIAGGGDVRARVRTIMDAMYPGFFDKPKGFEMRFVEIRAQVPMQLGAFAVEAFPMIHDDLAGPCFGYRLSHSGRTLAFTGDTGWTDALMPLARGADVFVSECCYVDFPLANHLNLQQIVARRADFAAGRLILTHMSPDMLDYDGPLPDAVKAFDGMRVEI